MNYNLLPWREAAELRRRLYRQWVIGSGVAVLFAGVLFAIVFFHEQARTLTLHQQQLSVAIAAAKAKRVQQPNQTAVVSMHTPAGLRGLLHQLFFGSADAVCLTSLHMNNTTVLLHGQAPSEAALSHFLLAWPVSDYFSSLHLQSMNQDAVNRVTVFEVSATLASSASEDDDSLDA